MSFRRFWAMLKARNLEFFRDRSAFGWNFLFPFLIVAGFGIIFGGKTYTEYKIGVFPHSPGIVRADQINMPDQFRKTRYLKFIGIPSAAEGLTKLKYHKIDFLLRIGNPPYEYWVSDASPKGYVVEQLFKASFISPDVGSQTEKKEIEGSSIRYIDWLFPGILAMNMMFSALGGVGYVVVRYRKNGALKRLKVTPLNAFEYLTAQAISRIFLLMFTLVVVWTGCDLIFRFTVAGSYADLAVVFLIGSLSLTALGLILASRGTSEEFTTGILNFISWPMMFLSEVWFSLEGAPPWVRNAAQIFPLTHMLKAVRRIMHDGVGLMEVSVEITILSLMTLTFLVIGAVLFSWNK
ncbi:MAG: ABC transporter permease [Desulfobacterales bacterium]|nr:MAG: ABC transporter permease [Desulfobacterales bacterium]